VFDKSLEERKQLCLNLPLCKTSTQNCVR